MSVAGLRARIARVTVAAVAATVVASGWTGVTSSADAARMPPSAEMARTYGLDWIPHIDPRDLPPTRAVTCLVDSGVSVTPTLPPDSPDGPVLERNTVYSDGDGTAGLTWAQQHGTRMAEFATSIWPATRILSYRAMPRGSEVFPAGAYERGLTECRKSLDRHPAGVAQLSLGCSCDFTDEEMARLRDSIDVSLQRNHTIIAAAGNDVSTVEPVAELPGVVAAVAGTSGGGLCAFASRPTSGVVGPGCEVGVAAGGSSTATTAVALTAQVLRTLVPTARDEQVEAWLRAGPDLGGGLLRLDAAASATAAGFGDLVARARVRRDAVASPPADAAPTTPSAVPTSPVVAPVDAAELSPVSPDGLHPVPPPLWVGRLSARYARGVLTVRRAGRTGSAGRLEVRVERRTAQGHRLLARRATSGRRLKVRLRRLPDRISVRILADGRRSPVLRLARRAGGRFR